MGIVKFLTVFDDETNVMLNNENMSRFKIAYLPTFYRYNNESFIDSLNATSYCFSQIDNSKISSFGISSKVFQYAYELISKRAYKLLIVVCPHGKFSPFCKEALIASKRFLRNAVNNNETDMMPVYVVDSKGFGIAPVLMAIKISDMYSTFAMNEELLKGFMTRFAKSSVTYLLTADKNSLGSSENLRAYRITSNRIFPLNLCETTDEKNIDLFIGILTKAIKKSNIKFAASYGAKCSFSTQILATLKHKYNYVPVIEAQYSIPSTIMVGINSLCIHFGDYI